MRSGGARARAAVQSLGRRGLRQRIPDAVRDEVLRYVERARSERRPWAEITATVGLSKSALTRWRRRRDTSPPRSLRRVRVVAAPAAAARREIAVVTAGGHRVEGLSVVEALEVVRGLG
jgi:hypothetical protein